MFSPNTGFWRGTLCFVCGTAGDYVYPSAEAHHTAVEGRTVYGTYPRQMPPSRHPITYWLVLDQYFSDTLWSDV
ncbi:unnamed protein product [Prunus armeniaca]|uniref:Uncharacterized protein n=1 Tax=Prunus armeniaca TaxID=36596 RepID=A0A6J5UQ81_PRUAR|nr:unnamed protein product [Prunus armeniaca]